MNAIVKGVNDNAVRHNQALVYNCEVVSSMSPCCHVVYIFVQGNFSCLLQRLRKKTVLAVQQTLKLEYKSYSTVCSTIKIVL